MPWITAVEPDGGRASWRLESALSLFRRYDSSAKPVPEDPLTAGRQYTFDSTCSPSVPVTNESFSLPSNASLPVRTSLPPLVKNRLKVSMVAAPLSFLAENEACPVAHTTVLPRSRAKPGPASPGGTFITFITGGG